MDGGTRPSTPLSTHSRTTSADNEDGSRRSVDRSRTSLDGRRPSSASVDKGRTPMEIGRRPSGFGGASTPTRLGSAHGERQTSSPRTAARPNSATGSPQHLAPLTAPMTGGSHEVSFSVDGGVAQPRFGSAGKLRTGKELFNLAKSLVKPYVAREFARKDGQEGDIDSPSASKSSSVAASRRASDYMLREASAMLMSSKKSKQGSSVIDDRHMWLSKRISQGLGVPNVSDVQQILTSKDVLDKVNRFFGLLGPRTLFIYCIDADVSTLRVGFEPEEVGAGGKVLYFVRIGAADEEVKVGTISDDLLVGECGESVIKSFSGTLQRFYIPLITNEVDMWEYCSDEDTRSFFSHLSRFSMTLTDVVQTLESRIHLAKVDSSLLPASETQSGIQTPLSGSAAGSSSYGGGDEVLGGNLPQLESVAAEWKAAADMFLDREDPTLDSLADYGPDAPLYYWRERLAHLNALNEQFEAADTRKVVGALTSAKSAHIKRWRETEARLREATSEANDIVKHLSTLNKHFEQIFAGTPSEIAEDLPNLFSKVKMVRVMSKYLQNRGNMTGLLVKITNQMIIECRKYIEGGSQLWKQDPRVLLDKFKECMNLNLQCQIQYRITKHERVGGVKELPFSFDESQIFAKFEHFANRLQKLVLLFETVLLVQTIAAQSLPGLSEVCSSYWRALEGLKRRPYDLLDYTVTMFERDYQGMCDVTAEMEAQLQAFIHESFEHIESTDQALDLLSKFHALMQRDNLRPYLNTKYLDIFSNFAQDLDMVGNMYERLKHDPPISRDAPPVAGRIGWVRHMLKMIEVPMHKFRHHTSLMLSKESKAIIKRYNKIAQVFVEYEVVWDKAWRDLLEEAKQGLNATLLCTHPETGKIAVNFDDSVLQLIREARYRRELGMDIPESAQTVLNREKQIKNHAQMLGYILKEYETMMRTVIPDMKQLYRPYLSELESALRPALTVLTWTSTSVDEFIQNVIATMEGISEMCRKVKDMYENRILRNLRVISNVRLIQVPESVVATEQFVSEQEGMIRVRSNFVNQQTMAVGMAVTDIFELVLANPAENTRERLHSRDVLAITEKFWELVYQAVVTCIKGSIGMLKARIKHSFGMSFFSLAGSPFFRVNVELVLKTLKTNPSLSDVQLAINRCALAILRSVRITPWTLKYCPKNSSLFGIMDKVLGAREIVPVLLLLTGTVEKIKVEVDSYVGTLNRFGHLWNQDKESVVEEFLATQPSMDDFIERLTTFDASWAEIRDSPTIHTIGPLSLSTESVKAALKEEIEKWKLLFTQEIHAQALVMLGEHFEWIRSMARKLDISVRDLDDVRQVSQTLQEIIQSEIEQEEAVLDIDQRFRVCAEFGFSVPEEHVEKLRTMKSEWERVQQKSQVASDKLRKVQDGFKADLRKAVDNFKNEARLFKKDFDLNGPMFSYINPDEGIVRMKKFQKLYEAKAKKIATFQQGEELFGLPKTTYPQFEVARGDLATMSSLYSLYTSCMQSVNGYLNMSIQKLSVTLASIAEDVQGASKKIAALSQKVEHYMAYKEMQRAVKDLADMMPLLEVLTNPAMRPRHWQEVMVITQTVLNISSPTFSLSELLSADLLTHRAGIEGVCKSAQAELACEEEVEEIGKRWQDETLSFANFKALGPVTLDVPLTRAVMESIEDSLVTLHTLLVSRASLSCRDPIKDLIQRLSAVQDLLEVWLGVQHIWCYVRIVFSAEDIHKQLPQEAKRFENVNKNYMSMMHDAFGQRYLMVFSRNNETMRVRLSEIKGQLEICQRFLSGYLDAKRSTFPRLFFASDTVLLEALSQNADINSMGHLLMTLFDNVVSLDLDKRRQTYTALRSAEGEVVRLGQELPSNMGVEHLLCTIETEMHSTMQMHMGDVSQRGIDMLEADNLDALVDEFPCQVCIMGFQFYWSYGCLQAMGMGGSDDKQSLQSMLKRIGGFLDILVAKLQAVKGRNTVVSLVQLLIQQRDLTGYLAAKRVREASSFDWFRQIRFSWDYSAQECEVRVGSYRELHGYEYVGQRQRLVAGPQNSLQFMFMAQALRSKAFTAVTGPSGAGKTELIKDFGRSMGQFVINFNCSAEITSAAFSGIFSGICQSGAWGVLDEPGRIGQQALSVMAQQIGVLLEAARGGRQGASMVDGKEMVFVDRASFFACFGLHLGLSVHPGVAGFTAATSHGVDEWHGGGGSSLPDNMRNLFRVMCMPPLDYEVVLRVRFATAQIDDAARLASLVRAFISLASVSFTRRPQYDFGTRDAMYVANSITSAAAIDARLKAASSSPEVEVIGVLKELYAPLLAAESACKDDTMGGAAGVGDEALLPLLLVEVFGEAAALSASTVGAGHRASAARSAARTSDLEGSLEKEFLNHGISTEQPHLVAQCLSLHEAVSVWRGLILLGPTGSCKSLCTTSLLNVLSSHSAAGGRPHRAAFLNPLSMGTAQLFGWLEPRTREWQDGAFSAVWRRAMMQDNIVSWIVLDGPIEASWAETLNTVLDDTRLLTLPNGERMPMVDHCRLIFEVDSLAGCSPATISRTGLLAFAPGMLSVSSILESWLRTRRSEEAEIVGMHLEKFIEPLFLFMERECSPLIPWNPRAQIRWILRLLEDMLADSVTVEQVPDRLVLERYVMYCICWCTMATLDDADRIKLDRRLGEMTNNLPAEKGGRGVLIDYILSDNSNGQGLQLWEHAETHAEQLWKYPVVSAEEFRTGVLPPLEELIVPTAPTITIQFVSKLLQSSMHPMVLMGEQGCGKSTAVDSILRAKRAMMGGGGLHISVARTVLSKGCRPEQLQSSVVRCVKKRQGRVYGPPNKGHLVFVVHDVNVPELTRGGSQPNCELLRDMIERRGTYISSLPGERVELVDMWFAFIAQSPSHGWSHLPDRLLSNTFNAVVASPTREVLLSVFSRQIAGRFELGTLPSHLRDAVMFCGGATVDLCAELNKETISMRANHHFSFTMHDMCRVVRGLLRPTPDQLTSVSAVISLWTHECAREFGDKLVGDARKSYPELLNRVCIGTFNVDLDAARISTADLVWRKSPAWTMAVTPEIESLVNSAPPGADLTTVGPNEKGVEWFSPKVYRVAHKMAPVAVSCSRHVHDLNAEAASEREKVGKLVLFPELVLHLLAIVRVLGMEGGHMVIKGSSKDGKDSTARLAAHIAGCEYTKLSSDKVVRSMLKDEIKKAVLRASSGVKTALCIPIGLHTERDALDVIAETVVTACNHDIFSPDEWDAVSQETAFVSVVEEEQTKAPASAWTCETEVFRRRVRQHLHIILAFSIPLDTFAERVSHVPAILGRFTTDIWHPWSQPSLEEYARSMLVDGIKPQLEKHRVEVCNEDIKVEVLRKYKEEREQAEMHAREDQELNRTGSNHSAAEAAGWAEMDTGAAVADAEAAEDHFRRDLFNAIRAHVPKQMAQAHFAMSALAAEYAHEMRQSIHYPFSLFQYYTEIFCEMWMSNFTQVYQRNLKVKRAVKSLDRCEKDIATLRSGSQGNASSVRAAGEVCESILSKMTAQTSVVEKQKLELAGQQRAMRSIESKLNAETEFSAQYLKELKAISGKCKEPLKEVLGHHINGIGEMKNPPDLVARLFDAVLIILGQKVDKSASVEVKGRRQMKDSWPIAAKLMVEGISGISFLASMRSVVPEELSPEQGELLQPYISAEDFSVERMRPLAGGVCTPVMKWVLILNDYLLRRDEITPFLIEYYRLLSESKSLTSAIAKTTEILEDSTEKVEGLRKQYDDSVARRQNQETADERKQANIKSAEDMIAGLKHQQQRWADMFRGYSTEVHKLSGNCSLASAFLCYCGPLDHRYRTKAVEKALMASCRDHSLQLKAPVNVIGYLCAEHEIAQLRDQGLMSSEAPLQSALIVKRSKMWPLMIDPHKQGVRWIANSIKERLETDVKVMYVDDEKFQPTLIDCICFGIPVLVLGVDTDVRMGVDALMEREIVNEGRGKFVTIGDKQREYNNQFQMILATTAMHPHYTEEFSSNLMIVNFGCAQEELESLILASVLQAEDAATHAEQLSIIQLEGKVSITVKDSQDSLLNVLCSFEGSLLDSTSNLNEVIRIKDVLAGTTKTKEDVKKMKAAVKVTVDEFSVLSKQCARLLKAVGTIRTLDPSYQLSMDRFLKLVNRAFDDTPKGTMNTKERLSQVADSLSLSLYVHIAQGLLSEHRPVWLLLLALQFDPTLKGGGVSNTDMSLLATAGKGMPTEACDPGVLAQTNDEAEKAKWRVQAPWLSPGAFEAALYLRIHSETFLNWRGDDIFNTMQIHGEAFAKWYALATPEEQPIPGYEPDLSASTKATDGGESIRPLMRLILIRCLRPDRFVPASLSYARSSLGSRFLEPIRPNMDLAYRYSDPNTPIIVVASEPCEAVASIQAFADRREVTMRAHPLGEGQKDSAQKLLISAPSLGSWVVLENPHLDDKLVASIPHYLQKLDHANERFRLYIVVTPHTPLPTMVASMSIRQALERPRGIKASLLQTYQLLSPKELDAVREPEWAMLLFAAAFMHSLCASRICYGPAGFSVPYDWRIADLRASIGYIEATLNGPECRTQTGRLAIPWNTIQHVLSGSLVGLCAYDHYDSRIINAYTNRIIAHKVTNPEHMLAPGFTTPQSVDHRAILRHIADYPEMEQAGVYGMTGGNDERRNILNSASLASCLSKTLVDSEHEAAGVLSSSEDICNMIDAVLKHADLDARLPEEIDMQLAVRDSRSFKGPMASSVISVFYQHECARLNVIVSKARARLVRIKNLLARGVLLAGQDAVDAEAIFHGLPPPGWEGDSWRAPGITEWTLGACARHKQLVDWGKTGTLDSVWLGGFLRPTAFAWLFAQSCARKMGMDPLNVAPTLQACGTKAAPPPLLPKASFAVKKPAHNQAGEASADAAAAAAAGGAEDKYEDIVGPLVQGVYSEGGIWEPGGTIVAEPPGGWDGCSLKPVPPLRLRAVVGGGANWKPSDPESGHIVVPCYNSTRRGTQNLVMNVGIKTEEPPPVLIMSGFAFFLVNDDQLELSRKSANTAKAAQHSHTA